MKKQKKVKNKAVKKKQVNKTVDKKKPKKTVKKTQQFEVIIKDVGGIAIKVFRPTKFRKYIQRNVDGNCIISPKYSEYTISKAYKESIKLTSRQLLDSLYSLYTSLNYETERESHVDLVIEWCKNNIHPYNLIEIANIVNDADNDDKLKSSLLNVYANFKFTDFIDDLVSLGKTYELYLAYEDMVDGNYETAFNLYKIGKYCEASSLFEKYKYVDKYRNFDYNEAKNNVILTDADIEYLSQYKESDIIYHMFIENEYQNQLKMRDKYRTKHRLKNFSGYREKTLIEYFKEHINNDLDNIKLMICEQFDSMHFEIKPSENGFRYVINLYSVFDYCWNTFSSIITKGEDPVAEEIDNETKEGGMKRCKDCKKRFFTTSKNALRCPECRRKKKRYDDKMHKRKIRKNNKSN